MKYSTCQTSIIINQCHKQAWGRAELWRKKLVNKIMDFQDSFGQRVLRVDQLDVVDYDQHILGIIQAELSKCFKYFQEYCELFKKYCNIGSNQHNLLFTVWDLDASSQNYLAYFNTKSIKLQPGILAKIDPELKAILSLIIWKYSLYSRGATVAQQMLEIKCKSGTNDGILSKKQTIAYGLAVITAQWLVERSFELKQFLSSFGSIEKFYGALNCVVMLHRFLGVLNFAVFLREGRYKSLIERTLRIYAVFSRQQSARQVFFEYMNENILKHAFAEFLFCILPLVDVPGLRNLLLHVMWKKSDTLDDKNVLLRGRCGVCRELPTNVHQTNCGHAFCYICIKAKTMADPSLLCPTCGEHVYGIVKPGENP